jgi:hypothetical protein
MMQLFSVEDDEDDEVILETKLFYNRQMHVQRVKRDVADVAKKVLESPDQKVRE